jgi:hypothetical protein
VTVLLWLTLVVKRQTAELTERAIDLRRRRRSGDRTADSQAGIAEGAKDTGIVQISVICNLPFGPRFGKIKLITHIDYAVRGF